MSAVWKIYLLAAVSFLMGTSEYMIAGILDKVAADIGVTLSEAGLLITAFSLAYAIGTPILMAATAGLNRRSLLLYALGLFIVGNVLLVILPGYGLLLVARVIMALGTGVFVVMALDVVAKLAPEGKQGGAMATITMGISASLILGVPIGRVIASSFDWKLIFGGIALLAILALPVIAWSIPPTKGDEPVPLRSQLLMMRDPRIAVGLAVTFFWILGYAMTFTYISPYLLGVTGMGEELVSITLFAYGVASLIGSKIGGISTDRLGVSRTLIGGMLMNTLMLVLLSAMGGTSSYAVFILLMLWSFFSWSSAPTQQYYLTTLAPAASGIMLSLNTSMLQLAMAVGSSVGGLVVDGKSLGAIPWTSAASVAVAAVAAALALGALGRRSHHKAQHQ
jgi:DHA1 family putative efflux transporter-like MFS transporter